MFSLIRTTLLLSLIANPAFALAKTEDTVKTAANRIAACVESRNANDCRENITASSASLFNRFVNYNLMDCLPQSVTYLSKKPIKKAMQVRVQTTSNDKKTIARLIFQQEENTWKLDIPESLRQGIGENWESQLNATEQVYLMLKGQMGDKINCGMIRNLASGLTADKK